MQYAICRPSKYLLPFSVLLSFHICSAQEKTSYYEFGLNAGRMVYQGDLTPSAFGSYATSRLSMGVSVAKSINTAFAIRGAILFGSIAGDDAVYSKPEYRRQRSFNFTSSVRELTAQAVWSLPGVPQYQKGLTGYLFAGGGFSILRVKPDASKFNAEYFGPEAIEIQDGLAADAAHGTPKFLPLLLAGAGVKYYFTQQWGVNAEASYRIIYTDYLDGFSESTNPTYNDHYMNYSIGVVYRTGRRGTALDCPKPVY